MSLDRSGQVMWNPASAVKFSFMPISVYLIKQSIDPLVHYDGTVTKKNHFR